MKKGKRNRDNNDGGIEDDLKNGTPSKSKMPDRNRQQWHERFEELKAYKVKHGKFPKTAKQGLGKWVERQRGLYKNGTIEEERKDLLNAMGFPWSGKQGGDKSVASSAESHASSDIQEKKKPSKKSIRSPLEKVDNKKSKKKEEPASIEEDNGEEEEEKKSTKEKSSNHSNSLEARWMEKYNEVSDFFSRHGHANLSKEFGVEKATMNWLNEQRRRHKDNLLLPHRKKLLEKIHAFTAKDDSWGTQHRRLLQYKDEHGDVDVPDSNEELGKWCVDQKKAFIKGTIEAHQAEQLIVVGFDVQQESDDSWNKRSSKVQAFLNLRKQRDELKAEIWLGKMIDLSKECQKLHLERWTELQRVLLKHGLLAEERKEILDQSGFRWNLGKQKASSTPKSNEGNKNGNSAAKSSKRRKEATSSAANKKKRKSPAGAGTPPKKKPVLIESV